MEAAAEEMTEVHRLLSAAAIFSVIRAMGSGISHLVQRSEV
jgi:hypothetical protein